MDEHIPTSSHLKAWMTRKLFRWICWAKADLIVGISQHTLKRFTLNQKFLKRKSRILYYGIDHRKFFGSKKNREMFCKLYNLPLEKKILLFCARIDFAKNPIRALEIFNELIKHNQNYHMLIVGSGGLETIVKDYINKNNLKHSVNYIGWSDDIPFILKNSDLLLYPHQTYPMEGLGIILVETQLSGTPILGSYGIGEDVSFIPGLLKRINLKEKNSKWADEINNLVSLETPLNSEIEKYFRLSSFSMPNAMNNLINIYQN